MKIGAGMTIIIKGFMTHYNGSLNEEGYLIIGKDESLPLTYPALFVPIFPTERIYQKFNPK